MTEERKVDPKDDRDFLVEAVRIAEGDNNIVPRKEHVKALHSVWNIELMKAAKVREIMHKVAKMAKDRKFPASFIPSVLGGAGKTTPINSPIPEEKKNG